MLKAAVLFWLPFAFIPFGVWVSQVKSSSVVNKLGYTISILGTALVLASPWTVPESPSNAVGHLLGFIAGHNFDSARIIQNSIFRKCPGWKLSEGDVISE